jgi:hypothetical protein
MIVKIQQSLPPSPPGLLLIYNKNRKYWWEGVGDDSVLRWMGDRLKVYAFAHIEGTEFVIEEEAPIQEW